MEKCFVIQPFDGDVFDKRYQDVFSLAIKNAGLDPYRVDQDPHVSIPIEDIERGITESRICFAEITLDNPNVWFELGYAIAQNKDVVIVCSSERETKFPFDIQHRSVIRYEVSSTSDFDTLQTKITEKIEAYLKKEQALPKLAERLATSGGSEGLKQHEVLCIAAMAGNMTHPEDGVSPYSIANDMERSGFTKVAATLATKSLLDKGFILQSEIQEYNEEPYMGYKLTSEGWDWIQNNEEKFLLKAPSQLDDEIPF